MPATLIDNVRAGAYRIPTEGPEADGTLTWDATTLVVALVDVGSVTGLGWTYADASCVDVVHNILARAIVGRDVHDVPVCWHAMQRLVRNLGRPGIVSCAMSAVDIALWDASARQWGVALPYLLGRVHDDVALYGSGGFTNHSIERLERELRLWVEERKVPRVKLKIGQSWGSEVERDLERVAFARQVVGPKTELFVDANGGYGVGQAKRIGTHLAEHGVIWFEEPVSSDDHAGLRRLRGEILPDVAAGEYGYDLAYFADLLGDQAVDCLQVDLTRCGGFTEWQRIAALAAAHHVDVSAHCAPNLSVHAAVSTSNIRHIEWFDDHDRIEERYFDGSLDRHGGRAAPDLTAPGHGFTFRASDAERFRQR